MPDLHVIFRGIAVLTAGILSALALALAASAQNPSPSSLAAPSTHLLAALEQPDIAAPDAPLPGPPPRVIASADHASDVNARTNTFQIQWRPPASHNNPQKGRITHYQIRLHWKTYGDHNDPARCGNPPGNNYSPGSTHTVPPNVFSTTVTQLAKAECFSWEIRAANAAGLGAPLHTDPIVSTRRLANNKDCPAHRPARPWGGNQTKNEDHKNYTGDNGVDDYRDPHILAGAKIVMNGNSPYNGHRDGCASPHHIELGDWCHRLNYPHGDAGRRIEARAIWSASDNKSDFTGQVGDHFNWFCYIEGSNRGAWERFDQRRSNGTPYHPGGGYDICAERGLASAHFRHVIYALQGFNWESDLVCAMNDEANLNNENEPRATHCGTHAEYNFQHRECQCRGIADSLTPTPETSANGVDRTVWNCQCGAAGAEAGEDGSCECPAGTTYHADQHACKPVSENVKAAFAVHSPVVRPGALVSLVVSVSAAAADPTGRAYVFSGDSDAPLPGCDRVELRPTGTNRRAGQCEVRLPAGAYELWADYEITNPALRSGGAAGRLTVSVNFNSDDADCTTRSPWGNPIPGGVPIAGGCDLAAEAGEVFADFNSTFFCEYAPAEGSHTCSEFYRQLREGGCLSQGLLFKFGSWASHATDLSCVCPSGEEPPCGGASADLLAEIRKTNPDLSVVRAKISEGANVNAKHMATSADVTVANNREGWPLLFFAVARGHAEVVSVLITSGADPNARAPAADFLMPFGSFLARRYGFPVTAWTAAENVLRHFGGALDAAGAVYDWNARQIDPNPAHGLSRNFRALDSLSFRYIQASAADKPVVERVADYMWSRGAECQDAFYLGETGREPHPLCFGDQRRRCEHAVPGINPAGGSWSADQNNCAFNVENFASANGGQVGCRAESGHAHECENYYAALRAADCLSDAELRYRFDSVESGQVNVSCVCRTSGDIPTAEGCGNLADGELLLEIRKTNPDLATVRALLAAGANPDFSSGGAPLIVIAAGMGHAEVVSVLITSNANPFATNAGGGRVQHRMAGNGVGNGAQDPKVPWRRAAEVLVVYGDVVSLAGKSASLDWNAVDNGPFRAMDHLAFRYNSAPAGSARRRAMLDMANYMHARGGRCAGQSGPVCTGESIPECPTADSAPSHRFSCRDCPGNPVRAADGTQCVANAAACGAAHALSTDGDYLDAVCECAADATRDGNACGHAPDAPGNFQGAVVGELGAPLLSLSWTIPEDNGFALSGYGFWIHRASPSSPPDCEDSGDFWTGVNAMASPFGLSVPTPPSASAALDPFGPPDYGDCIYYAMQAVNAAGGGPLTVMTPAYIQQAPDSPLSLSAALGADSRVSLSWTNPSTLRGAVLRDYVILRAADGSDSFVSVAVAPAATMSFADAPPTESTDYRYKLRLRSSAGEVESEASNTVRASDECPPDFAEVDGKCGKPPDAPQNFRAVLAGEIDSPQVSLNWTAPAGTAEVTGYVFRTASTMLAEESGATDCAAADFGDEWLSANPVESGALAPAPSTRMSIVVDAQYGECAVFAASARNAFGAGAATVSSPVYIQHAPGPPGAPTAVLDDDNARISWARPSILRGAAVLRYEVHRGVGDGPYSRLADAPSEAGGGGAHLDASVPDGQTLRYKVRAISGAGNSPLSPASAPITSAGTATDYGALLEAEMKKAAPDVLRVAFYLRNGASPDREIDGRIPALVYAAVRGHFQVVRALILAGANPSAKHPLYRGGNVAHLVAVNPLNLSYERMKEVLFEFGDNLPEGSDFDWNAVDLDDKRATELMLDAYLEILGGAAFDPVEANATSDMGAYMVARGAFCRDGPCFPTQTGSPTNFSAALSGEAGTDVALTWDASTVAAVAGYFVWQTGGGFPSAGETNCDNYDFPQQLGSQGDMKLNGRDTTRAVFQLGPANYGRCYRYVIRAFRNLQSGGTSRGPEARSNTVRPATSPVALSMISATLAADRSARISWRRLTDAATERRGSFIDGYQVARKSPPGDFSILALVGGAASVYRDASVAEGMTYVYRARAVGDAGFGGWSPESDSVSIAAADAGGCAIGELADAEDECRRLGDACGAALDAEVWRAAGDAAECGCPEDYDYLSPAGKHCAEESGRGENPSDISRVSNSCILDGGYATSLVTIQNGSADVAAELRCEAHSRPADLSGGGMARSYCVIAVQHSDDDPRREADGFLRDVLFCHDLFPALSQAGGSFSAGHTADNPRIYGACPAGEVLNDVVGRCAKDCANLPHSNLGRGAVSGLTLVAGDSASADACRCPSSAPVLNGTECAADIACPSMLSAEGADNLSVCVDAPNAGACGAEMREVVGTYAGDDLAVLCVLQRDVLSRENGVTYTSRRCWLSARDGFLNNQPLASDPAHIPSCADLAGGAGMDLPSALQTISAQPYSHGECGSGRKDEGGECVCAGADDFELGGHCIPRTGNLTETDDAAEDLRAMCAAFGGRAEDAGNGQWICSEADVIDTFCILGSADAFPCEGLFKHVRSCNLLGRPALDPFFCAPVCGLGYAAGSECVVNSEEWRLALGVGADALRATVTAASGYLGDLYSLSVGAEGRDWRPRYSARPEAFFLADGEGVLSALSANAGGSVAFLRAAHPDDSRVYIEAEVRINWVGSPGYGTLSHVSGGALTAAYTLTARALAAGHPGGLSGGAYALDEISIADGGTASASDFYSIASASGEIESSGGFNRVGVHELRVVYTHPDMLGELILIIPLEVQ